MILTFFKIEKLCISIRGLCWDQISMVCIKIKKTISWDLNIHDIIELTVGVILTGRKYELMD